jgi:methionine biosynthesis protein MetW
MITRADFDIISDWVPQGARVLDLGCGDGALLKHLAQTRAVKGYGIENDPTALLGAIDNGVSVIQANLEDGLRDISNHAFDVVVLSQTLQAIKHTESVVAEMLRVGKQAIVTFPNFGYWRHRVQIALGGHMPVSSDLPYEWYDTPNVHLFTVRDFEAFCEKRRYAVLNRRVLAGDREAALLPNLTGTLALYQIAPRA